MAIAYNASIVRDNLVFAYDMGNTQKSWKGQPSANLLTYSDDFSNAIWTKNASTITSDLTIAPDETTTADKLIENTSAAEHYVLYNNAPMASGTRNTISVYAKANERGHLTFYAANKDAGGIRVRFNLSNGTSTILGNLANLTVNPSINVGNNWWRLSITIDGGTGATVPQVVFQTDTGSSFNYTGTANYGVYIWGAQLEAATYATPYIPTTTASTSRTTSNNIIDLSGNRTVTANSLTYYANNTFGFDGSTNYSHINSVIELYQTSYTVEAWIKRNAIGVTHGIISDTQFAWFYFVISSLDKVYIQHKGFIPVSDTVNSLTGTTSIGTNWTHVVGVFDLSAGFRIYVNGVLDATGTNAAYFGITPGSNRGPRYIGLGISGAYGLSNPFNGLISSMKFYNIALSAQEVQQNFNALRGRYNI